MANKKAKKNEQAVKATKTTANAVNVVVMCYHHSKFLEYAKEQSGAIILDCRVDGTSKSEECRSKVFRRKLGERYVLAPKLGFERKTTAEAWLNAIPDAINGVCRMIDDGQPVILTGWHSLHLKALGHVIAKASPKAKVELKLDRGEDNDPEYRYKEEILGFISTEDFNVLLSRFLKPSEMKASGKAANPAKYGF